MSNTIQLAPTHYLCYPPGDEGRAILEICDMVLRDGLDEELGVPAMQQLAIQAHDDYYSIDAAVVDEFRSGGFV